MRQIQTSKRPFADYLSAASAPRRSASGAGGNQPNSAATSRNPRSDFLTGIKETRPRVGPGLAESRWLDGRRRGDQTELLHLVEPVEVDASLSDLSVLHAEKLDAVANYFLVGRRDGACRALERAGVRAFHDDLLHDPGAAEDLAADLHLVVRERLQPRHRECSRVLGVVGLEAARRVELDVVGMKRVQSFFVVGVHRRYETIGCRLDFRHCLLLGVSAKRRAKGATAISGRQPWGAHTPRPQSRNSLHSSRAIVEGSSRYFELKCTRHPSWPTEKTRAKEARERAAVGRLVSERKRAPAQVGFSPRAACRQEARAT